MQSYGPISLCSPTGIDMSLLCKIKGSILQPEFMRQTLTLLSLSRVTEILDWYENGQKMSLGMTQGRNVSLSHGQRSKVFRLG